MIYEYHCTQCGEIVDIVKTVSEMTNKEYCKSCNEEMERQFVPSRVHFTGTKVEDAEYNPGLGVVTKSKAHRNELARQRGLVEIGNEKVDTVHKHFDSAREDKLNKSYE